MDPWVPISESSEVTNDRIYKAQDVIMKTTLRIIAALIFAAVSYITRADVLELKDGKTLNGKFVGGTAGTIRFETSAGVQVVETSQALALTFTGGGASSGGSAPTAAAPAPAKGPMTIPAGTAFAGRLIDPLSSKDKEGKKFSATLDSDLAVGGAVVLQAGTKFYGKVQSSQQARRYTGQSSLNLQLTEVVVGSTTVPIVTGNYSSEGARSG